MLNPTFDNLIIRQDRSEQTSAGGIVLTADKKAQNEGEVIAAGPGRRTQYGDFVETSIYAGQRVAWPDGAGVKIRHEGEEFLVLREQEVIAIIE